MKTRKIAIIATTSLLATAGIAYGAIALFRHETTCNLASRGTLEELRQACADEIRDNKETYAFVTSRNDEIRGMMGWSDEDLADLGLLETK